LIAVVTVSIAARHVTELLGGDGECHPEGEVVRTVDAEEVAVAVGAVSDESAVQRSADHSSPAREILDFPWTLAKAVECPLRDRCFHPEWVVTPRVEADGVCSVFLRMAIERDDTGCLPWYAADRLDMSRQLILHFLFNHAAEAVSAEIRHDMARRPPNQRSGCEFGKSEDWHRGQCCSSVRTASRVCSCGTSSHLWWDKIKYHQRVNSPRSFARECFSVVLPSAFFCFRIVVVYWGCYYFPQFPYNATCILLLRVRFAMMAATQEALTGVSGSGIVLPKRKWVGERGDVTVMHMNMLAQSLCFDGETPSFPHVAHPGVTLSWEHRLPLIIEIITSEMPDFVCVVECDKFEDLSHALEGHGYGGSFRKKCADDHEDGCAIFHLRDEWKHAYELSLPLVPGSSHIAMYSSFDSLMDPGKQVTIVSTHLKAKPGFEDIRVAHVHNLLKSIPCAFQNYMHFPNHHVIITGDFNDTPDSMAVATIREAPGLEMMDSRDQYEDVLTGDYYTTYKKRDTVVRRVIDYIFFSSRRLTCTGVLDAPPLSEVPDMLPAHNYPSDHIALCASFSFTE